MSNSSVTVLPPVRDRRKGHGPRESKVRTDIQGLRAIAVSLVLIFHLWPNRLSGGFAGVDVFFVISGFLITSHLVGRPPRSARDLASFWSRRIRRLLPASLLVLAASAVATRLVAPDTQWANTAKEIVASALYVVNWRLASSSVDYLAAENTPSPVQHFWSLSVEEQFYFVWPVLILLLVALATRRRWNVLSTVLSGLGLVVAASLAYSVYATVAEPARAYFVTPTRIWELGIGGLLAVVVLRRGGDDRTVATSLTLRGRSVLTCVGLAAIAFTAVAYTGATPFPGWQALLPVLGTAAVIAANPPAVGSVPGALLARRPVQWLGDVSYSVYLWHWPLVVLVPYVSGGQLGRLDKLTILVTTLLLAWLTKRFVEDRFRIPAPSTPLRRPFQLAVAGMAVVVGLGVLQVVEFDRRQDAAQADLAKALSGDKPCFGAAALAPGSGCEPTTKGPVVPAPAQAVDDKSDAYSPKDCFESMPYRGMVRCSFGDPKGTVSIALVGNSHAGHWLPALQEVAERKGWKITTFLSSECTATTISVEWDTKEKDAGCLKWGRRVMKATSSPKYDLVVTAERNGRPAAGKTLDDSYPVWLKGYEEYVRGWADRGTHVLALHDTPFPSATLGNIPECIAANTDDLAKCEGKREDWVPQDPLVEAITKVDDRRLTSIDLTDRICTEDVCPAAVGGVTVYFDGSHVSKTYSKTLAPYLAGPLTEAVQRAVG